MKKIESSIVNEINKRIQNEMESESIIGSELKMSRINQSMTLTALSKNTCSPSYLSKIETNKIIPNKYFVSEICEKLSIDPDKISVLYNSRDLLEKMVSAFLFENNSEIQNIYEEVVGLNNYRAVIVCFIKYLFEYKLDEAYDCYAKLIAIIKNMNKFDLAIFGLFSGVLHYYGGSFDEARDDLKCLDKLTVIDNVKILKNLFKFYIDLKQAKMSAILSYELIHKDLIGVGFYKKVEEISYYMGIYYAKYQNNEGFELMYSRIKKPMYLKSLAYLYAFFSGASLEYSFDGSEVNDFVKTIINSKSDIKYAKSLLEKHQNKVELDYDCFLLEYLMLNQDEKSDYISNKISKVFDYCRDDYLATFFLGEIIKIGIKSGRYKQIAAFYRTVWGKQ